MVTRWGLVRATDENPNVVAFCLENGIIFI